ncbi:DUF2975 domain-containing protein [Psychroserpens damuponensis]|uniref:DUF2975 domain-containing protein n=1 Tax=Psychroserpens damuponensis TaxID=943936 RepID=UPI00058AEABD|nr:DUF2975 domain-containing protein [Psychroserpens damuponensis]
MRNKNFLVIGLHAFFAMLFWILIIVLGTQIAFEAFTNDGKIGSFSVSHHHSKGYSLPVYLKVKAPNAVFNNSWFNITKTETNSNGLNWSAGTSERFSELTENDKIGVKNIIDINFPNNEEVFTTNESVNYANSELVVKSKNFSFLFIQLLKAYFGTIIFTLIIYFLMKIFGHLKRDLNFTPKLFKMIRIIGAIIILDTVFELIMSFIIGKKYDLIKTETLVDNDTFVGAIRFSMNPRLEFDFMFFIIGLSLLVLASLLKRGSQIQQENDLTI